MILSRGKWFNLGFLSCLKSSHSLQSSKPPSFSFIIVKEMEHQNIQRNCPLSEFEDIRELKKEMGSEVKLVRHKATGREVVLKLYNYEHYL